MDQPVVAEPREAAPAWARDTSSVLEHNEPRATQPQLNFIQSLLTQKDLSSLTDEERASLKAVQTEDDFWDTTKTRLTKVKASRILDRLTKLPNRPKDAYEPTRDMAERFALNVPAGRYAVEADSGELRFYNVWVSRDKKRLNVYVEHGPDESDLKYQKQTLGVLRKIAAAGIRQCAIRYGMEIGSCSNCGRRLTNRISRELGIGPICGGRMFGDDWKTDVKIKRAEILARGEDPDEELQ